MSALPVVALVFEKDKVRAYNSDGTLYSEKGSIENVCSCWPAGNGKVWVLTATTVGVGCNKIKKWDPVANTIGTTIVIAVPVPFVGRTKGFQVVSDGFLVNNGTHVVKLDFAGGVIDTYTPNATDFSATNDGKILFYVNPSDKTQIKVWDLINNSDLGLWLQLPDPATLWPSGDWNADRDIRASFPCVAPDCTVFCVLIPRNDSTSLPDSVPFPIFVVRIDQNGNFLQTYPIPADINNFDEWPISICFSNSLNRVWGIGDYDNPSEQQYFKEYRLSSGMELHTTSTSYTDLSDSVGQIVAIDNNACTPCCDGGSGEGDDIRLELELNDIRQSFNISPGSNEFIIPLETLIEALRNDVINVSMFQKTGLPLSVATSLQIQRVTWVTHRKEVGRNIQQNLNGTYGP